MVVCPSGTEVGFKNNKQVTYYISFVIEIIKV